MPQTKVHAAVLGAFTDPWPLFSTFAASKMTALSPRAWFFSATALGFHGDRNRRMRCPLLVCSALAIGAVVSFGSDAHAREQPVYCDPPTVTVVARGAIVGGKLCNGPWGCRCAHWFCQQCSTLPTRRCRVRRARWRVCRARCRVNGRPARRLAGRQHGPGDDDPAQARALAREVLIAAAPTRS